MEKWREVDEVLKMVHELPNEKLRKIDEEMRKKPNFEHLLNVGKKVKRK